MYRSGIKQRGTELNDKDNANVTIKVKKQYASVLVLEYSSLSAWENSVQEGMVIDSIAASIVKLNPVADAREF